MTASPPSRYEQRLSGLGGILLSQLPKAHDPATGRQPCPRYIAWGVPHILIKPFLVLSHPSPPPKLPRLLRLSANMGLDQRGDISVVEIIVYAPILFIAITLVMRYGFSKRAGWVFLLVMSIREYCARPVPF